MPKNAAMAAAIASQRIKSASDIWVKHKIRGFCMENYVIVCIVIMTAAIGALYTAKHFRRGGGCCGGGEYKVGKKRLSRICQKKVFTVEGMRCSHCKKRIEEVINDIKNVSAKADLRTGTVIVCYAETADDQLIKSRVEKSGYSVTDIKEL